MSGASSQTVGICFRCQTRLLLGASTSASTSYALYTRRGFTSSAALRNDFRVNDSGQRLTHWRRPRDHSGPMTESSASLGVKALGQQADIILLRERARLVESKARTGAQDPRTEFDKDNKAYWDILEDATRSNTAPSEAEIIESIGILRPSAISLPQDRFDNLEKELNKSYSASQLRAYITHILSASESLSGKVENQLIPGTIRRSRWRQGVKALGQRLPIAGGSIVVPRTKAVLAKFLLVQVWDLSIAGEVGQLELSLHPRDLEMLSRKDASFFANLGTKHNALVRLSDNKPLLMIASDREACDAIVLAVENQVKNVQDVEVDLLSLKSDNGESGVPVFSPALLAHIESLTSTKLMQTDDGSKLMVTHLDPTEKDAEDALRLLISTIDLGFDHQHKSIIEPALGANRFLNPVPTTSDMPWIVRQNHWTRLQDARSEKSDVESVHPSIDGPRLPESVLQALNEFDSTAIWEQNQGILSLKENINYESQPPHQIYLETGASLARVLHQQPADILDISAGPKYLSGNLPNMISLIGNCEHCPPDVQRLAKLEDAAWRPTSEGRREEMVIYLVPSPWAMTQGLDWRDLPPLELILWFKLDSETSETIPVLQKARFVLAQEHKDFLLPNRCADIRFYRKAHTDMLFADRDPYMISFLENSRLDINRSGQLRTPSTLKVPLPSWALRNDSAAKATVEKNASRTEYLFLGLEFREESVLNFEQWPLQYATIERGSMRGRDIQLRLSFESSLGPQNQFLGTEEEFAVSGSRETERTVPMDLQELARKSFRLLDKLESGGYDLDSEIGSIVRNASGTNS